MAQSSQDQSAFDPFYFSFAQLEQEPSLERHTGVQNMPQASGTYYQDIFELFNYTNLEEDIRAANNELPQQESFLQPIASTSTLADCGPSLSSLNGAMQDTTFFLGQTVAHEAAVHMGSTDKWHIGYGTSATTDLALYNLDEEIFQRANRRVNAESALECGPSRAVPVHGSRQESLIENTAAHSSAALRTESANQMTDLLPDQQWQHWGRELMGADYDYVLAPPYDIRRQSYFGSLDGQPYAHDVQATYDAGISTGRIVDSSTFGSHRNGHNAPRESTSSRGLQTLETGLRVQYANTFLHPSHTMQGPPHHRHSNVAHGARRIINEPTPFVAQKDPSFGPDRSKRPQESGSSLRVERMATAEKDATRPGALRRRQKKGQGSTRANKKEREAIVEAYERTGVITSWPHKCPRDECRLPEKLFENRAVLVRHLETCKPRVQCLFCTEKLAVAGRSNTANFHRRSCDTLRKFKIDFDDQFGVYALLLVSGRIGVLEEDENGDNQLGMNKGTLGSNLRDVEAVLNDPTADTHRETQKKVDNWVTEIYRVQGTSSL